MSQHYVHVITNFTEIGGAEQMMIRAINASEKGYKHTVISLMGVSEHMKKRLSKQVDFHALGAKSALDLIKGAFLLKRLLVQLGNVSALYSWMYHANFVAALSCLLANSKTPLIWGVRHSLDDYRGEKLSTKIAILGGKLLSRVPKHIVHCSKKAMHQHIEFGYGKASQCVYIPNGYQFEQLKQRHFEIEKLVIGAAGRFHEAKDYQTLFCAVAPVLRQNTGALLKVAGREMTMDNPVLVEYLREFGIEPHQVELMGQQDDMVGFYHSVDFFILSSKTEGFPNVLAEASGYGCITFSTRVGDAPEIIDSERIVEIADAMALTQLLQKYIAKTPVELREASQSSADYVRNSYAIDVIANKLFSLGHTQ
ncbi:glycosyltransferase [Pseudoalteromonas luteoviolacea]|uniref:glycosyltransferase n=1 Tax=Pseudoalteromonas luteoviolacea TaxID=43657 RepID=UPI001B393F32|nr:glycosyltransferase [Pseudoalteromonas luteoviolacea]MBQ4812040.1 glycosyltransferase [Pseudoalteromonas luteoviolacea]